MVVTIQTDLLRRVDQLAGKASRSSVFEQALTFWFRQRRQTNPEHAIEAYYLSQRVSEQGEDERWARLGDETVARTWGESES